MSKKILVLVVTLLLSLLVFNVSYIHAEETGIENQEEPLSLEVEKTEEKNEAVSEPQKEDIKVSVQEDKTEEPKDEPKTEEPKNEEPTNDGTNVTVQEGSDNEVDKPSTENENQNNPSEPPTSDGNGDKPNTEDEDDIHGGEIYDIQKVKVLTKKVDEDGNMLAGAKLAIINSNGKIVDEWTSTTDVHETLLPDGTYVLRELEAPEGYDKAEDVEFVVKVEIEKVNAGVDYSELPCEHYGGTPLYYVQIAGNKHEVYCINQDLETPDDNSKYDGEILEPTDIRDFTQQTVYVDAKQKKEKIDVSEQSLNSKQLYDKILDIIYHRHKAEQEFDGLSPAEIRYVTESALKNYTNAGLTRVQRVSKSAVPTGYTEYDYYVTSDNKYVWYLYPWYRSFVYTPDAPIGKDVFTTDIGNGDAFGTLARHWSTGHGGNSTDVATATESRAKLAKFYELYNYLIRDEDHHPEDMHLYIYSTGNIASDTSYYDFDGGAYQNLLGVTGYFEDVKQQEMELTVVNNYSNETRNVSVVKIWDDKDDYKELRPKSVTVHLIADKEVIETVTLDESNEWKYTFEELPVYNKSHKIIYEISEDEVPEYTTEIQGDMEVGFTVINTHSGEGGPVPPNPQTGDSIYTYIVLLMLNLFGLIYFSYSYVKNN